jgi:hypothetical protein
MWFEEVVCERFVMWENGLWEWSVGVTVVGECISDKIKIRNDLVAPQSPLLGDGSKNSTSFTDAFDLS